MLAHVSIACNALQCDSSLNIEAKISRSINFGEYTQKQFVHANTSGSQGCQSPADIALAASFENVSRELLAGRVLVGLSWEMVLAPAWLPCLSSCAHASVEAEKRLSSSAPGAKR